MNDNLFLFFHSLVNKSAFLDGLIVFIAKPFSYIVIFLAIVFLLIHKEVPNFKNPILLFKKRWKEITLVFLSGIFAWFIAQVLKSLIKADRPLTALSEAAPLFLKDGYAFPSGHAAFFTTLALAIFFSHKNAGYIFLFFALLIGVARIVAGVHFPIDILAGFALGALVAWFLWFAIKRKSV